MLEAWIVLAEKHHDELSGQDKAFIKTGCGNGGRACCFEYLQYYLMNWHFGGTFPVNVCCGMQPYRLGLVANSWWQDTCLGYRILDMIDRWRCKQKLPVRMKLKTAVARQQYCNTIANSGISYPEKCRGTKRYAALKEKPFSVSRTILQNLFVVLRWWYTGESTRYFVWSEQCSNCRCCCNDSNRQGRVGGG